MAVTRKPILSCLVLALLAVLTGECFIGAFRSPQPTPRQLNSRLPMQGTQVEVADSKEMDDSGVLFRCIRSMPQAGSGETEDSPQEDAAPAEPADLSGSGYSKGKEEAETAKT
eukprot:s1345_g3.t1